MVIYAVVFPALPAHASRASSWRFRCAAALLGFALASAYAQATALSVYAAGDIADCRRVSPERSGAAATARLIESGLASDPQALVLTLGDHTYPLGELREFLDCYHPTWGRFRERTLPVPGNHEYYIPHAAGYFHYFGAVAGPARKGYYSKRVGNWLLIALNSYLSPAPFAAQLEWLQATLAREAAPCILAYAHHPRYSSGGHGNNVHMQGVWEALAAARAELLLAAHDHGYERFAPQDRHGRSDAGGVRQFVVGTGGAVLTRFRFARPQSEVRDNGSFGVLKLVLQESGYTWQFIGVAGDVRDAGAGSCH